MNPSPAFRQNTREKGNVGEDLAAEFLSKLNFKILKRNFIFGRSGEIDIVAQDGEELVFVEVKMRTSNTYGDPLESINYKKQNSLRKTAEGYLFVNKLTNVPCRFDVVVVDITGSEAKITHLTNAM